MTESVETAKKCKQCGEVKTLDNFRKYTPRGKGVHKSVTGHNTICRQCESINSRVGALERKRRSGEANWTDQDERLWEALKEHFLVLNSVGLPPVTAAAKRLIGVGGDADAADADSLLSRLQAIDEAALRRKDLESTAETVKQRYEEAAKNNGSRLGEPLSKDLQQFVDKIKAGGYADEGDRAYDDFQAVKDELFDKDPALGSEIDALVDALW